MNAKSRFLSCDWGTSNFRCRVIDLKNISILAEVKNNKGIAHFSNSGNEEFEKHLIDCFQSLDDQLEEKLSDESLILSGMASASIGWHELPYAEVPVAIGVENLIQKKLPPIAYNNHQITPLLISGLKTDCDVMRGEEVELMGLLSRPEVANLLDECWVVLPGTHSKHIHIQNQKIVEFHTHLTGELFNLLASESVLKHSLSQRSEEDGFCETSFIEGVEYVLKHGLSPSLFKVRSLSLLQSYDSNKCFNYLSGLLIGNEMVNLKSIDKPILLSASKSISRSYHLAAKHLGLVDYHAMPEQSHDVLAAEGQALFFN